jgi:DHA2 family multidrug resistance protein
MAFFFVPLVAITLSGLRPESIPSASGLSNFARITAGAFGTSIITTLWEDRAAEHHAHLTEAITDASIATTQALSTLDKLGMTRDQSLSHINHLIEQQAFMLSANDIFAASAALFLLLAGLVWLARRGDAQAAGAPGGAGGAH